MSPSSMLGPAYPLADGWGFFLIPVAVGVTHVYTSRRWGQVKAPPQKKVGIFLKKVVSLLVYMELWAILSSMRETYQTRS